MTTNP
jgi:hypothetical protein